MRRAARILPRRQLATRSHAFGVLASARIAPRMARLQRAVLLVFLRPQRAEARVVQAGGTEVVNVTNLILTPHFTMLFEAGRQAAQRVFETRLTTGVQFARSANPDAATAPAAASLPGGRDMTFFRASNYWARILSASPGATPLATPSAGGRTTVETRVISRQSVLHLQGHLAPPQADAKRPGSAPGAAVQMAIPARRDAPRERLLSRSTSRLHALSRLRTFHHEERASTVTTVATRHLELRRVTSRRGTDDAASRRSASVPSLARDGRPPHEAHAFDLTMPRPTRRPVAGRAAALPPASALVERRFRAPETVLQPAAPQAKPSPQPQQAPKPPEIDIAQLDKELWRRFQKRFRVEQERRGRR